MENCNSDEVKNDVNEEPPKPTLIDKLKSKRWTFKVKNNFTEYLTVEPLICFYMLQIFVVSLTQPYHFHKACVSLDQDTYFCDVITINENSIYKKCVNDISYYCKGLDEGIEPISCWDTIKLYERNETKVYVNPEDYMFCKVIQKTLFKATTDTDSLVGLSAMIITFLVVMIVSIWSDKYSKRKMCLMLPIFGQLLTSIINLHGALSTFLSFEFINIATIFIESLTGGMSLFLFGCFSYMSNETIKRKLLFRFGIMSLILTVYRYIPHLYNTAYEYYRNDDSYINLISLNLVLNIICLLYVKVILNESKREVIVNALDNGPESLNRELECISNGKHSTASKHNKSKQLAKAFSLDVIWDYILIIFKKRIQPGRLIIILFLAIVLVDKISPYDARFKLILEDDSDDGDGKTIDIIDIDGAIFVIISIIMLVFKISDVFIAILVIGIPIAARIVMVLLGDFVQGLDLEADSSATDFYSPFKRIAACSLLLAYVDKNESRIFLVVQVIAYLPKVVFQLVAEEKENASLLSVLDRFDIASWVQVTIILLLLPGLVFCGLGFLYKFAQNYDKFKTELISPKTTTTETIAEKPINFIKPDEFEIRNEYDNNQIVMHEPVSQDNENFTHL